MLDYVPVPEAFKLPPGANFGATSGIALNSKGNIFVIHRGPMPLMEFDPDGDFIRGFGDGLFERPHGLRIDGDDNIWATDVVAHLVRLEKDTGWTPAIPLDQTLSDLLNYWRKEVE